MAARRVPNARAPAMAGSIVARHWPAIHNHERKKAACPCCGRAHPAFEVRGWVCHLARCDRGHGPYNRRRRLHPENGSLSGVWAPAPPTTCAFKLGEGDRGGAAARATGSRAWWACGQGRLHAASVPLQSARARADELAGGCGTEPGLRSGGGECALRQRTWQMRRPATCARCCVYGCPCKPSL